MTRLFQLLCLFSFLSFGSTTTTTYLRKTNEEDVPIEWKSRRSNLSPTSGPPESSVIPSDAPSIIPSDLPSMMPSDAPSDMPSSGDDLPTPTTTATDGRMDPPTPTPISPIPEMILVPPMKREIEVVLHIDFLDNPAESFRWSIFQYAASLAAASIPYKPGQDTADEALSLLSMTTYFFVIENEAAEVAGPSSFTITQDGIELLSGQGDFDDAETFEFTTLL